MADNINQYYHEPISALEIPTESDLFKPNREINEEFELRKKYNEYMKLVGGKRPYFTIWYNAPALVSFVYSFHFVKS